ncbi:LamG domain-containing protein [Nostoc sp. DedQUE02]|uniref:LamG domain-containing protein n=1 Tax=Nostoc sp. DedQUE02 TaxID=3075388 RepID=UPI0039187DD0
MKISNLKSFNPTINDVFPIIDIDGGIGGRPILRKATLQSIISLVGNTFDPTSINNSIESLLTVNNSQETAISSLQTTVSNNNANITSLQNSLGSISSLQTTVSNNSANITSLQNSLALTITIPSTIKTTAQSSDYFIGIDSTALLYKISKADLLAGLSSGGSSSGSGVQPTTLLLIHGDGSNNGTSIIDSSAFNRTATKGGSPVTSTTQKKFGTSSLYFDGASYITFPSSTDFDLKRNNFAAQCWIYPTSVSGSRVILDRYSSTIPFSWQFAISSAKLNFYIRSSDASSSFINLLADTTLLINTWYYVGVRCINGILSLWVNGELDATTLGSANLSNSLPITIGKQGNINGNYYQGYIDELRFIKLGETDLSTIPTAAFT